MTSSGEILQKKHNPKQNVNILKQILKLLETRSVMRTRSLSYLNAACVVYNVGKVKCAILLLGIGGVHISLSKAMSP